MRLACLLMLAVCQATRCACCFRVRFLLLLTWAQIVVTKIIRLPNETPWQWNLQSVAQGHTSLLRAGLFLAPGMVGESLKGIALAAGILADLGYSSSGVVDTGEPAMALSSVLATVDMGSEAAAFTLLQAVQQGSCLSASSACQRGVVRSGGTHITVFGQGHEGNNTRSRYMIAPHGPGSIYLLPARHGVQGCARQQGIGRNAKCW